MLIERLSGPPLGQPESDQREEVESYPSWSNLPKMNEVSSQYKGSPQKKAFSGGALTLTEMDDKTLSNLVNSDSIKKYFIRKK
ncbi:RNA-directed DNA polymerase (Reverse transcriptase), Ribonuclease H [Gossypium australe]|uniref:RNA-directed DNA polymerase (Reverse transcriptase), Ribonuclease H n=1 Tax=Gossypium australe TaxID=47621 RepID=A0A5B6UWR8_9ROSI|nr:RNA-directed DNA polymerase (Reverse transcriptase), Ribonuclease H [Gossypium australe]